MELKCIHGKFQQTAHRVLIVPLWNWNVFSMSRYIFQVGFNRTFMELKFVNMITSLFQKCVLIVPLWNWNDVDIANKSLKVVGF